MKVTKTHLASALLGIALAVLMIWGLDDEPETRYFHNEGRVFGTYYNIRYSATEDLQDSIKAAL